MKSLRAPMPKQNRIMNANYVGNKEKLMLCSSIYRASLTEQSSCRINIQTIENILKEHLTQDSLKEKSKILTSEKIISYAKSIPCIGMRCFHGLRVKLLGLLSKAA